jgi:hypothetical protein
LITICIVLISYNIFPPAFIRMRHTCWVKIWAPLFNRRIVIVDEPYTI